MSILSESIQNFVAQQRLGFLATVCPDGTPNLSPKGLTFVYSDEAIVMGEVRSPNSIENLLAQPIAELNVVDRNKRRGFRFKGRCEVYRAGEDFDRFVAFLREEGAQSEISSVIVMTVARLQPLISPAYDDGTSEADLELRWQRHYSGAESDILGE